MQMMKIAYQRADVGELFVGGDKDRLDEELVAALWLLRGVFLHGLEEDCRHVSVCCDERKANALTAYFGLRHGLRARCARCSASHSIYNVVISCCYRPRRWVGAVLLGRGGLDLDHVSHILHLHAPREAHQSHVP